MNLPRVAKTFFRLIDRQVGPFDQPIQFHVFPFDAGGSLNFLTKGAGHERFVTYVTWDLFGHADQKRGGLGRYEIVAHCDDEEWCLNVLNNISRQSLSEVFEPGDTLDIGPWVGSEESIQGVVFEEMLRTLVRDGSRREPCGLLRCIGITRLELEYAMKHGVPLLVEHLKRAEIHPYTVVHRDSVELP